MRGLLLLTLTVFLLPVGGLHGQDGGTAVSALVRKLCDSDRLMRSEAADRLAAMGLSVVPSLLPILAHEDPGVRADTAEVLGRIGSPSAAAQVCRLLDDREYSVRRAAGRALGAMGSTVAVPALLRAMEDPIHWVRAEAAFALGRIGDKRALPVVTLAWREDPREEVKIMAAFGAYRIGGVRPALKTILKGLESTSMTLKTSALEALRELRDPRMTGLLIEALKDEGSVIPVLAAEGLVLIDDDQARRAWRHVLAGEPTRTWQAVVKALGLLGPAAVPDLMRTLRGTDRRGWSDVIGTLCRIGAAALPAVLEALPRIHEPLQLALTFYLCKHADHRAVPVLIPLLNTDDLALRRRYEEALTSATGKRLHGRLAWEAWYKKEGRAWCSRQAAKGGEKK